jgi:hypothetical protein
LARALDSVVYQGSLQEEGTAPKAWPALSRHLPPMGAFFDSNCKESNGGIGFDPDLGPDLDVQYNASVAIGPIRR